MDLFILSAFLQISNSRGTDAARPCRHVGLRRGVLCDEPLAFVFSHAACTVGGGGRGVACSSHLPPPRWEDVACSGKNPPERLLMGGGAYTSAFGLGTWDWEVESTNIQTSAIRSQRAEQRRPPRCLRFCSRANGLVELAVTQHVESSRPFMSLHACL